MLLQTPQQFNSIETPKLGNITDENKLTLDEEQQLMHHQMIKKTSKSQPKVSKNLPSVFFANLDKKTTTK